MQRKIAHDQQDSKVEHQFEAILVWLDGLMPYLAVGFTVVAVALAAGHAILYRREARSTTIWVGLIFFVPLVGAALYAILGINRIRRKAHKMRRVSFSLR